MLFLIFSVIFIVGFVLGFKNYLTVLRSRHQVKTLRIKKENLPLFWRLLWGDEDFGDQELQVRKGMLRFLMVGSLVLVLGGLLLEVVKIA